MLYSQHNKSAISAVVEMLDGNWKESIGQKIFI